MTTDQTAPTTTLTARTPEDILAVVPVVLGFDPTESMVMLTFGSTTPFHARVDLPDDAADVPAMAAALVDPAEHHRVPRAFLVAYSDRDRFADRALQATAAALRRAGIEVIDCLLTDGCRWRPVPGRAGVPLDGVPYDLSAHPFAAQAVYDGRVVHASRDRLAATVAADQERVALVVPALAALTGEPLPALEEGRWARELVVRHVASGSPPDDHELARLLRGLLDIRVRDAAWSPLRRATAPSHVAFWTDVVRRAPDLLVPAPAALLAFAAWQAGQGALAWCAVDRCVEADPGYSLAGLVAEVLTRAVPPDTWEGDFDWTEGLDR